MSNAKRPSLERKHTRATEAKRSDELDQGVRIELDGKVYEVRHGDLTALDTRALRKQTELSFVQLMQELADAPDIDSIAALIWLAGRLKGDRESTYEEVAEGIGYDVLDRIVLAETGAEEVDEADPEA